MARIEPELLENLVPLRELTPEALQALAGEVEIEEVPAKTVIFRRGGADGYARYVLSGTVVLVDGDNARRTMTGTGNAGVAPEPLARTAPFDSHAVAGTDVKLIRLSAARIQQLLASSRLPEAEVAEVSPEGGDGDALFYRLFDDLMNDRLELPSMPDIAVRVQQAIAEHEAGPADLARILQSDPVIAARLIQAANGAAFGGQRDVDALQPAITRLGLSTTREVVTAIALKAVFHSSNPLVNKRMVELWMHSSLVAATSQVLARKLSGFAPDRALLAGLVHDIGVIPMLTNAASYPALVKDPGLLEETIREYRGQVGSMILRRWNFPEDLIAVPLAAEDWMREVDAPGGDYGDLVMTAQVQTMAGGPAMPAADAAAVPAISETSAYRRLGLEELGITDSASIMQEARGEIAEAQRLLIA
ncbi:HD-like signal output (HDOD) protein [Natronocella acetinitrilica]|uniref:HD-like signal output (HDOD) protein n=1 Tax=Natronocella acetinitrilica TaxID=414046 RepID=A0AAE3G1Y4_9GAMM|nr:HDOD domain-containing protein [Natronocella acetinitrilica]MCP1674079.1 HD-like signal output (HDOD) protein [Natronocella acetinitrilica]